MNIMKQYQIHKNIRILENQTFKKSKHYCSHCNKETKFNHKTKLINFPFCWAFACEECGEMFYY